MNSTSRAEHSRQATRVTLVGMALDTVLGAVKVLIGVLFNSYALLVDGIHSFSDVASDLMVLAVARLARREPDAGHPYGHERFESFGTVLMGALLVAVAGAIAWDSVQRLWLEEFSALPGWPVLVVAALSVASKEWIFHYTRRVGTLIGSDLIIANAWHSRSDALSSIIVFVGALGAIAGWVWFDALAAILVAMIIARVGWNLAWENVKQLVDTAMPAEASEEILQLARETEGVRDVHALRTRKMGQDFLLDLHLQVAPSVSVSEGHQIGVQVTDRIRAAFNDIRDITFHIDPEKDSSELDSHRQLPARSEVTAVLKTRLNSVLDFSRIHTIRLHYLSDHVTAELFLNEENSEGNAQVDEMALTREIERLTAELPWLRKVRVWTVRPLI